MRGRCVSGHVVRESSSRIRHRNALTERAWKDAVQGLGKAGVSPEKGKKEEVIPFLSTLVFSQRRTQFLAIFIS